MSGADSRLRGPIARLRAYGRLSRLLGQLARQPHTKEPDPGLREVVDATSARGTRYDRFRPRNHDGLPLLTLHGCTLNGKDDLRLQHFSRCLARAGRDVYVPTMPGLGSGEWDPADVDLLVGMIEEAHAATGQPVDLIGFSFSASYALLAAAREPVADKVRHLLGFGAYHSLVEVYRHFESGYLRGEVPEAEWDDHIYLHLLTAYRQRERLGLEPGLVHGIESLLCRYCHPATAEEKRAFYDQHLRGLGDLEVELEHLDRSALEALSPAGKLERLRCRVYLLHDPEDLLVPAPQARALADELRHRSGSPEARLLFTSMLQHVSLSDVLSLGEVRRLLASLLPLIHL